MFIITTIIRTITAQIEIFWVNCLSLLLVFKNDGKIKNNTANKKTADIISCITITFYEFFQNFFAFSKKLLITGLDFSDSIFLNSSKISFCFEFKLDGTSVIILMYKSP